MYLFVCIRFIYIYFKSKLFLFIKKFYETYPSDMKNNRFTMGCESSAVSTLNRKARICENLSSKGVNYSSYQMDPFRKIC